MNKKLYRSAKDKKLGGVCGVRAIADRPYILHSQAAWRIMQVSTSSVTLR